MLVCLPLSGADYGAVILMDSRYCDDGSPNDGVPSAHRNLPKWMRHSVRTLSMRPTTGNGSNSILGGYTGLASGLRDFFTQAPAHSQKVLATWKAELESSQQRASGNEDRVFDKKKGEWVSASQKVKAEVESL